jgi:cyanophycinase
LAHLAVTGCVNANSSDGLISYFVGSESNVVVEPSGPALLLSGGGETPDEVMRWFLERANGGDVVVLRTYDTDVYNDDLYRGIGGIDSAETLVVQTRAAASSPRVQAALANAEAIFVAGGDQATYVNAWRGTAVETELRRAWGRGAVIGGTSAGTAIMGETIFSAQTGGLVSAEALSNPYGPDVTLEPDMVGVPVLRGIVTDTHYSERERFGRLLTFVARMRQDKLAPHPLGLGIDEDTALWVDADGTGKVVGAGSVHVVDAAFIPKRCQPGEPLEYEKALHQTVHPGQTIALTLRTLAEPDMPPPRPHRPHKNVEIAVSFSGEPTDFLSLP